VALGFAFAESLLLRADAMIERCRVLAVVFDPKRSWSAAARKLERVQEMSIHSLAMARRRQHIFGHKEVRYGGNIYPSRSRYTAG
jgi:hypothetical protein